MTTRLGLTHDDEYETQFSGFCCEDVTNYLKEAIESAIVDNAERLKNALLKRQTTEEDKIAVNQAVNKMKDVLLEKSCSPIARLHEQIPTFLGLPSHVLLPEDEVQRQRYSSEEEDRERQKLQEMKGRYKRAQYLKTFYTQELTVASKVQQHLTQGIEFITQADCSGLQVLDEKSVQIQRKHIQDLLGLEVKEAGVRLISQPLCAESNEVLDSAILASI